MTSQNLTPLVNIDSLPDHTGLGEWVCSLEQLGSEQLFSRNASVEDIV
ncbi:MAG: hypothetical protein QF437_16560 [Planctomycetota bacterium]|nr:hypothetical protein [Planctomycetota bacterium]MDP7132110.1 hypothetical protein [Planctomycetota bacterium]MDP7251703.1 hypothetical protein [Planctomycetota bacterium]